MKLAFRLVSEISIHICLHLLASESGIHLSTGYLAFWNRFCPQFSSSNLSRHSINLRFADCFSKSFPGNLISSFDLTRMFCPSAKKKSSHSCSNAQIRCWFGSILSLHVVFANLSFSFSNILGHSGAFILLSLFHSKPIPDAGLSKSFNVLLLLFFFVFFSALISKHQTCF